MIDPAPRERLAVDDLGTVHPVVATDLERSVDGWTQVQPARPMEPREGGWPLQFVEPVVTLEWSQPLDAALVERVQVEVADHRAGRVDLSWKRSGEDWGADRRIRIQVQDAVGDAVKSFEFDLASHPRWVGAVDGLRLDVYFPGGSQCVLKRVTASRIVRDPERFAEAVQKAWQIDLDHEVRPARLAPPGSSLHWEVEVHDGARLYAGYGLMPGVRGAVEFEISASAPGRGTEVLWAQAVDESDEARHRWRDVMADLGRFAGTRATITLETAAAGDRDGDRYAMPVWGSPMVATPRRGRSPASVILTSADTLRADRMSLYGNGRKTSPAIDRWARRSAVVFRNAVVQSPWTLPSHVSMLTGLDAPRHGVNHDLKVVPEEFELMAELLRDAGWVTCAVTGGGFLNARYGFDQGFDRYFYWPQKGSAGELEAVIRRAMGWMSQLHDLPLFLFLHSYEVHGPYRVRQPYYDRFVAAGAPPAPEASLVSLQTVNPLRSEGFRARDQQFVWQSGERRGENLQPAEMPVAVAMYDSGIAHLDAEFGRLLRHVRSLGMADRTMVVFTSDHGEALGEHGRGGHGYLYESNLLVPLVMSFPDRRGAGRVIQDQVRSIDMLPTILDFVGVAGPDRIDGISLLPLIDGDRSAAPGGAWTYASSFNLGVSLRVANQTKYTFNNTAWNELYGERSVVDLAANPDDARGLPPTDGDRQLLDDRIRTAFLGAARGLVIELANLEDADLTGRVDGRAVSANGVKSWRMHGATVHWVRRGELEYRIVPGGALNLVLERWDGGPIVVEGGVEGAGSGFVERIEPEAARAGLSLRLAASGWRRVPGLEADEGTGVTLFVVGGSEGGAGSPLEDDAQLREQLRALGYLQ